MSSMSAGPPRGDGPDSASTLALALLRSSPTTARPVMLQPGSSGNGHHSGTPACSAALRSDSTAGCGTRCIGATAPCCSQLQLLDINPGARSGPAQRGQVGGAVTRPPSATARGPVKSPGGCASLDDAVALHDALDR